MKSFILSISALSVMLLAGCKTSVEHIEENSRFLVTQPLKKDTALIKEYVCQIHAYQHIEIRALERGYLEKTFVDEGQFVKQGQLLFQIMPMFYQAELKKNEAEVSFAEIEYRNTKLLADSNIVSSNELALVKAKLEKAKAELTLAQLHLGFTEIKAPFDGIMDKFLVRLGSLVEEGELLTNLSDNSKMWVYFNVPEAEYLDYESKKSKDSLLKVQLLMANNQPFPYSGIVETIEADFNNETGNIAFRATFPNPDKLLRHGETGNVRISSPLKNAIIIPQKATFEVLEKKYVFVVDENHIVHQREITIEGELPDIYIIKNGLKENEKILYEGIRKVKDKDKISFEYISPQTVISKLKVYAE